MTTSHHTNPPNSTQPEDLDRLAGEYVLGTLPAAQRRALEQRMAHDSALQHAVDEWQARLFPLNQLTAPVMPTASLWERIDASIEALQPAASARPTTAPGARSAAPTSSRPNLKSWWSNLNLWRGLAGSGFAMAAVLAAVLVTRVAPQATTPQYMVVLVAPQDKAPGWVIQAGASARREISLIPLGVAEVPADKALEFWTKADGWNGPVSLGLVKPGQSLQIALDKLPPLQPNQLFELTLEPPTGSPIGKPTGPIQFIGRAVKVI